MKRREIVRLFDEIVAFAEVERFVDTPVKRYSSGMYVRLAFAVAAHLEPEVMVVDEVLAVGDAAFQKRCLGKMEDVANRGRTVLFVSHNMAAVTQLCHRAIWLERGQLRMTGPAGQVVKTYLSDGSFSRAERLWSFPGDAPGDNRVRLLACRLKQAGERTNIIDINRPCQIEIDFQTLEPARNLISGVNLYNEDGVCLFANCDWRSNELGANRYRKRVEIPAQLLAEGAIRVLVQLVFYDPDIPSVILPDALQFDAADSDHPLTVRGHWKGDWPGVLRVGLHWSDAEAVVDSGEFAKEGLSS
jgi:lipopolysaccharide transport system ATP-binding protein